MTTENFYEVLGLPHNAAVEDVEKALREQRKRYRLLTSHPERAKAREGEDRLELLDRVEQTLLNPSARASYDESLRRRGPAPRPSSEHRSTGGDSKEERLRADMRYAWENENWNSLVKFAQAMHRIRPDDVEAWEKLAAAYLWGDWDYNRRRDVMHAISQARRYGSDHEEFLLMMERTLAQRDGDYERVMGINRQLMALKPEDTDYICDFIISRWNAGQHAEALQDADNALAAYPDNPQMLRLHALIHMEEADSHGVIYNGSTIINSKEQVKAIRSSLSKVRDAYLLPYDLMQKYRNIEDNMRFARRRPFTFGRLVRFFVTFVAGTVVLSVIWALLQGAIRSSNQAAYDTINAYMTLVTFIGLPIFAFYTSFPPYWKINQRALTGQGYDTARTATGILGIILMFFSFFIRSLSRMGR